MQKRIVILGDSRLVQEYTASCSEKGYDIREKGDADLGLELTNIAIEEKKQNLIHLDKNLPQTVPILSSSVTVTVAEQATWLRHPSRLIGIGAFPTMLKGSLMECAAGVKTDHATRSAAEAFASSLGKSAAFVEDSVGMVMPRILCMLVNEAYFAMMEGVAEADAIDTAMKLGTNYPGGPVEWGQDAGLHHVAAVIHALHRYHGEDRYRCAPLLSKAARASADGS